MNIIRLEFTSYGSLKNDKELDEVRRRGVDILQGNNWLTPDLIGYVLIPDGFCEIAEARGVRNDVLNYGVTTVVNKVKRNDLSQGFVKYQDAIDYIQSLIDKQ